MLSKSKKYYTEALLAKYGSPKGASISEVDKLEQELGIKLPHALREYYLWMGKHSDGPLIGTDCFIGDLKDNTAYLQEFLTENGLEHPVDSEYLVFYSHQGYVLAWIYLKDGDMPNVYYFGEGNTDQIVVVDSIDEWFLDDLSGNH